ARAPYAHHRRGVDRALARYLAPLKRLASCVNTDGARIVLILFRLGAILDDQLLLPDAIPKRLCVGEHTRAWHHAVCYCLFVRHLMPPESWRNWFPSFWHTAQRQCR